MEQETQVSPVAETQNQATEPTEIKQAEVVTAEPSEQAEPQTSEKDERDKALARMERRINKKHAEAAAAIERARLLEERLKSYETNQPQEQALDPNDPAKVEAKARELAAELVRHQEVAKTIDGVLKAGRELPEFDKACNFINDELPFYERNGKPTPFLEAVLEFDEPAKLLHHLGTNPDLVDELAELNHTRRIRRLDAIERELKEKATPKTSSAPKPLAPVKGSGSDSKDPSQMTDAEFAAWRRRQIAQRR